MSELHALRGDIECYNNQSAYPIFDPKPVTGLPDSFDCVVCRDKKFIEILKIAARVATTEAAVCISGDSGVGKELVATAIHRHGKGNDAPLVKINCAAIPGTLFESELFGYERGAFTGAVGNGKKGKIELADGGTLFLDEVGELPPNMQVKLLRVLQEQELERVGGNQTIKVDFRLITATNRDLEQMIEKGTFREDLYYRLNVIRLDIPPLRDRKDDIPDLVRLFLSRLAEQYGKQIGIDVDALAVLMRYSWPGNARELKNIMTQAYILCEGESIAAAALPEHVRAAHGLHGRAGRTNPDCYNLNEIIPEIEKDTIAAAMKLTGNNKIKATKLLGISRRCLYQKLEKYQLV